MRHLDLFSGIGGFALATEMVWEDVEHIFCDNDPFSQEILKKHWPNSLIYGDIKELTAERITTDTRREYGSAWGDEGVETDTEKRSTRELSSERRYTIDLLTGGFPCQPFSVAGRRRGTEDDRHLWPEMLRVIRETNPTYVLGENVGGLLTWNDGLVFEQVCSDLEAEGYEVCPLIIPACAVNAPHRRDRVWIVAHAISSEHRGQYGAIREKKSVPSISGKRMGSWGFGGTDKPDWQRNWTEVATALCRMDDGVRYWVDGLGRKRNSRNARLKALGNAIVPQVAAQVMLAMKSVDDAL
jgi:DNA (cytosine-5)-methyltransferase 1